jgi:rfaE bifunctional protein kinase chain/domain/rfaE bifunctional protein nucleotidyltransferase chain/domain
MTPQLRQLPDLVRARPPRVTVVGDVILDRWLRGGVQRVSREAPVPVVEVGEPESCPGGAANTAVNLAAMGAEVELVTVLGDDPDGRELLRLLAEAGVGTSGALVRPGATTASKTRIVGADQIIVRVDQLSRPAPGPGVRSHVLAALEHAHPEGALVFCDYGAGLFDDELLELLASHRPPGGHRVVDAHDLQRWRAFQPDVVTPNAQETERLLGRPLGSGAERVAAVEAATREILSASGAGLAVVTLDRDGTAVLDGGHPVHRTHAHPAPEHQASGAGDTFVAALAIALATGATPATGASWAQAAADVVVARPGTAVCSLNDLDEALGAREPTRALGLPELTEALAAERERGRRIVFTNGCFDVIHRGHTTHLRQAKQLGDVLVVALNDDASVSRLKGPERPVNPVGDRVAVLEALGCVDHVVVFGEDTPIALLTALRPDVYAKGGDYTPEMLAETEVVRGYGGEVRILDYIASHSTTGLVDRIRARALP